MARETCAELAGASAAPAGTYLFEVAFEVCWRLGGIYTVLRSKAPTMTRLWGDRYCLIGPYHPESAETEFEPRQPTGPIAQALDALRRAGVRCHFGRWLVGGNPRVILLETSSAAARLEEMKYFLWKDHGIGTRGADAQLDATIALGYLVRDFLTAFCQARDAAGADAAGPVIAHFHEWMGAVAIPLLGRSGLPVATVFTTHATLLGRYLSSAEPATRDMLVRLGPDEAARHFDVYDRFCLERAAAAGADVFTTVSELTAGEAQRLLGRPVDVLLPNGLNVQRFAAIHEFQNLHLRYKQKLHEFAMSHFFPSYEFELDQTLYFFMAGRYEYRNKGIDLFIDSLARLNGRLRAPAAA